MVNNIYKLNWLMYHRYCERNGLSEGRLNNFIKYMEEGLRK